MSTIAERVLAARDKVLLRKEEFKAAEQAYFAACNAAMFTDRDDCEHAMFGAIRTNQGPIFYYTSEFVACAPSITKNPIENNPLCIAWRAAYAAKIKARNRYTAAMRKLMTIGVKRNGK